MSNSNSHPLPQYRKATLQDMYSLVQDGRPYALIDVRSQEEYDTSHLPGAICIPDIFLTQMVPTALPHHEHPIFVYCDSGRRSLIASQILGVIGYTQVYDLGSQSSILQGKP